MLFIISVTTPFLKHLSWRSLVPLSRTTSHASCDARSALSHLLSSRCHVPCKAAGLQTACLTTTWSLCHPASCAGRSDRQTSRGVTQGLRGLALATCSAIFMLRGLTQLIRSGSVGHIQAQTCHFPNVAAAQVPLVMLQAFASSGITSAATGGGIPSSLAVRQQLVEQPLLSIVWQQLRGKKRSTLDVGLKASKPITPGTLLQSIALDMECGH